MQSIASLCKKIVEEDSAIFPRVTLSTFSIRQLGMEDLLTNQTFSFCKRELHTWVFSYSELFDVPALQDSLSALEIERAALFSTKELSSRYTYARGLLRTVLSRYVGVAPEHVSFEYSSLGKPYINNRSLHFNLSHSEDVVFLVISEEFELGADVEKIRSVPEGTSIADRWFTKQEAEWICSSDHSTHKSAAFLRCWVIREAFVKAVGFGLMLPLNSFGVLLPEFTITEATLTNTPMSPTITKHERSDNVLIIELTPQNGYCAAIAVLTV